MKINLRFGSNISRSNFLWCKQKRLLKPLDLANKIMNNIFGIQLSGLLKFFGFFCNEKDIGSIHSFPSNPDFEISTLIE